MLVYLLSWCGGGDTQGAGIYGDANSVITLAGGSTVARNNAQVREGVRVCQGRGGIVGRALYTGTEVWAVRGENGVGASPPPPSRALSCPIPPRAAPALAHPWTALLPSPTPAMV
jgi:hypothetical protein